MDSWKTIETQKDIETLFDIYFGFHDSCIVSISYQSGTTVDCEGTMHYSGADAHQMAVLFQSQMVLKNLELLFVGLRQMHLVGWEDNYSSELSDAHLAFAYGLLPGKAEKQIVWASYSGFSPDEIDNTIHEPADTYIVADKLLWRLVE